MTTEYKILWNLKSQISNLSTEKNTSSIQYFSDFTKTMITQGKLDIARRCFKLAEQAFIKGDHAVKLALQNVFLCSLSITIACYRCEHMLPQVLKSELHYIDKTNEVSIRRDNFDEL